MPNGAPDTMTSPKRPAQLSEADARVLDELLENGGLDVERAEAMTGEDAERAGKIRNLLGLLEDYPVEDASDDLVHATLARVNRAEDEQSARMSIGAQERFNDNLTGKRWRFPDLFATAAAVLLAIGVIWPVMNHARQSRLVALDHDNLRDTHEGLTRYAAANDGLTPMEATAGLLPDPFDWIASQAGLHNRLIREECDGHADENDFHRPGGTIRSNPYSFQVWQPGIDLASSDQPIASNTNPLCGLDRPNAPLQVSESMRNANCHDRLGQNVLFGDGHVETLGDCTIDGDRIWDPGTTDQGHVIAVLRGEIDGEHVIFLVH